MIKWEYKRTVFIAIRTKYEYKEKKLEILPDSVKGMGNHEFAHRQIMEGIETYNYDDMENELNKLGADGWELISFEDWQPDGNFSDIKQCCCLLKRQID